MDATILNELGEFSIADAPFLSAAQAERISGWTLKPEGMCQGDVCVPLPLSMRRGEKIDIAAFWRHLGNPVAMTADGAALVLGQGAEQRNSMLAGLKAPDFTLRDLAGIEHSLSDQRGKKVLIVTWASWCGCRFDLPVWQGLFAKLKERNFTVLAIAEESRGAEHARQWIEAAKPGFPCLIDPDHRVADLYGLVNVPQAVWIDENGIIVRPPETAGSTDYFRSMDLKTRTMAPEITAKRDAARQFYLEAVRAWVLTGKYALPGDAAKAKLPQITPAIAEAHAQFKLGLWLHRHDRIAEAKIHFAEAARLHPDSWNMFRQAADLEAVGNASGPEFWQRVKALGGRDYYPPPDLPAFPKAQLHSLPRGAGN